MAKPFITLNPGGPVDTDRTKTICPTLWNDPTLPAHNEHNWKYLAPGQDDIYWCPGVYMKPGDPVPSYTLKGDEAIPDPADEGPTSIQCPRCAMVSRLPQDVEQGYCGNCHEHTAHDSLRFQATLHDGHKMQVFEKNGHDFEVTVRITNPNSQAHAYVVKVDSVEWSAYEYEGLELAFFYAHVSKYIQQLKGKEILWPQTDKKPAPPPEVKVQQTIHIATSNPSDPSTEHWLRRELQKSKRRPGYMTGI